MLSKNLSKTVEFVVELKTVASSKDTSKAIPFTINTDPVELLSTPKQSRDVKKSADSSATAPQNIIEGSIKLSGKIAGDVLAISSPFTGELIIEKCSIPITSVELQLMRVESCGNTSGSFDKESSEIQNVQMADGDVPRNLVLPLFFIFPRLFCSPSMTSKTFTLDYEVNLIVCLSQGKAPIVKNFPIKVVRA